MRPVLLTTALLSTISATCGCASREAAFTHHVTDHVFEHAAVAADHPVASRAGLEMLQRGGNAVDAAVATSFTLSVVRPYSCGIGGGGFMVIHLPADEGGESRQIVLNYREQSPGIVDQSHYVKLHEAGEPHAAQWGVHASGVPGTVAGLLHALETWGTLDRATVMAPAIRAAEEGFTADASFIAAVNDAKSRITEHPELAPLANHLRDFIGDREAIQIGDILRNPAQARALRLIARQGESAFYRGEIADAIVSLMEQRGGPITHADLQSFDIVEREPIRAQFRDYQIISMPPPSSGGVALAQMFGMMDARYRDVRRLAHHSADYVHFLTEMAKHAFADRAAWLADDAYVDVPIDDLTAERYLDELAWSIDRRRTMSPDHYGSGPPPRADSGTSHLSVIDENGMAVACTETINYTFGSMVAVPGFGFMLNNEMDDFTTIPGEANLYGLVQSTRNLPQPGKRPLSSMSPTIVLDDAGRVVAIAGASGGPRIISGTFQCLVNCLQYGMTAGESVALPRFHHQWMPDVLQFERDWIDKDLRAALEAFGHEIGMRDDVGVVQLIYVDDDDRIHAASDPRKGGEPAGY